MFYGNDLHNQFTEDLIFNAIRTYVESTTAINSGDIVLSDYDNVFDPENNFSNGVYTVTRKGVYFLQFRISSTTNYVWDFYIRKNATRISCACALGSITNWLNAGTFAIEECDVGDELDVYHAYHTGSNDHVRYEFCGQVI